MTRPAAHVVIGTAGHIDHGKTSLVRRLTGVDTDRLPEEKKRGITIVLGFAPLVLPNGRRVGVIDVPGHERFVKNMVAGAGGIDFVLLVVAADEGVMPQTREHLEICRLLKIHHGVVALTKIDRADQELIPLVVEDVRASLAGTELASAPIVPCSSTTGEGIDRLIEEISRQVERVVPRDAEELPVMPIDRVFSMKGFGSVVTGTLLLGRLRAGDTVEIVPPIFGHPIDGPCRVRSLQVFHQDVTEACAGDRTAVGLAGPELSALGVGQLLVSPGRARPTRVIDADLRYLASRKKPLKTGAKALFHAGTAIVECRLSLFLADKLEPGERGFARIRTTLPVAVWPGQHFIVRGFDQPDRAGRTIGGGVVLDPEPVRRRRHQPATEIVFATLAGLWSTEQKEKNDAERRDAALDGVVIALTNERGPRGSTPEALARRTGRSLERIERSSARAQKAGEIVVLDRVVVSASQILALEPKIVSILLAFHQEFPLRGGMSLAELTSRVGRSIPAAVTQRACRNLVGKKKLSEVPEGLQIFGHRALGALAKDTRAKVQALLDGAGLEPPSAEEIKKTLSLDDKTLAELTAAMVRSQDLLRAGTILFGRGAYEKAKQQVLDHLRKNGSISTQDAKTLLGVSRKYLIPFMELLDKQAVTVRVGEIRKAGTKAKSG